MDDPAFSTETTVDVDTQEVLLAASQHNIPRLRTLLRSSSPLPDPANVEDPETGYTPLHAAIAACDLSGEDANGDSAGEQLDAITAAKETMNLLLQSGAIWNALDNNNETPGCIAKRLGLAELYEIMVDAGVRAELLLNRLDSYALLGGDDDDEEEEGDEEIEVIDIDEGENAPELVDPTTTETTTEQSITHIAEPEVEQDRYLESDLTISGSRILDQDKNGVMMAWESQIMEKSAARLLPSPGLRVLNIGHGMGIVDTFLQSHNPSEHHIIEAHPSVLSDMKSKGWDKKSGVTIHEGRWQDILPDLLDSNTQFDAIYYDTFAESYSDFRDFFSEHVIGLLDLGGRWSFFNGMGADRQISYDVYQKVCEMDLFEAGYDIEWESIEVPDLEQEGEWEGVRRKYWDIKTYRLPVCKFME